MSRLLNLYRKVLQRRLAWLGVRSIFRGMAGERLHVYEFEGSSEGLDFVLIHGLGADASAHGSVIKRLLPHARRLWAPELPGHGFSDTIDFTSAMDEGFDRVAASLDALIERPVVLVGNSLGGAVAIKYALHAPQNVARLVLVSPAGAPISNTGMDGLRDLFLSSSIQGARDFIQRLFHQPPVYAPIMAWFVRSALSGPTVRTFLNTSLEDSFLKPEEVQALSAETLLFWGRSERVLPKECLRWYQVHMPSCVTIERPENFGHAPHLERPDDLVQRILAFADQQAE